MMTFMGAIYTCYAAHDDGGEKKHTMPRAPRNLATLQHEYCITATRKTLDTRHACGGRHGNGIFHCILGVKESALFHLEQIEPTEVSFRFVLRSKTNSSPNECALFAICGG
ncbi:hypothetical protein AVEN_205481-1 [Araneus ventricosus]|uniref:Uncharacterized protein n=1 Tax=Araneus ventricosus TaxID=182803 RepID=A0A4Y2CBU2_ARAVE|nr:hypothetical protein AVEN_205481-1 [Araneus ventricosus]